MASVLDIPPGTIAEAKANNATVKGIVRFCGTTAFAPGRWVGMELYEAIGKNDGSVAGTRYFECKPNYGVFVRIGQVTPVEAPSSGQSSTRPSRPTSVSLGRPGAAGTPIRQLQNRAAETPTGKQTPPLSLSRSVQVKRPTHAPKLSTSMARPVPSPIRIDSPASERPAPTPPPAPLPAPPPPKPQVNVISQPISDSRPETPPNPPAQSLANSTLNPPSPGLQAPTGSFASPLTRVKPPSPVSPTTERQHHSEEQELRAKIRAMEIRREVDGERIKELEKRIEEADQFVSLRPRLQQRLNTLGKELLQAKRDLQDSAAELQVAEAKLTESSEQLEMVMLDKEVAEERAEAAELELEDLKEKLAVAQVELNVLREGGEGGSGGVDPADGKFSLAYIQLERQNERLKEALLRLRDISQETEQDQRRKIAELEKELAASEEMQSEFDATLQRLANADVQIESLKQQLDDAMGAEDMLVQLTERNLLLGEKIEEMRVVIEDLEALKELNDELEENHIETEKGLQEDIESKESQIREATRKIGDLEEAVLDYDQTVGQFRELVTQLSSELDSLRAEHQSAQSASAQAASQAASVMSLNIKLQSNTLKNQAKNIELELQNLKARQANELLAIIQPYLPQIYIESDGDSTNTYLFFKRMASKADLLNSGLAERYSLPDSLNGEVNEALIGICEMRGRIAHLSVLCKRFSSMLRRCDPETFLNTGRIYPEVNPLERRLDIHIDYLKQDTFRAFECVTDVRNMVIQFEHLTNQYLPESDLDLGERELDLAISLDHDVEFFASAMAWTKTNLLEMFKDEDIDNEMGDEELEVELVVPLQKILDQCRSTRTVSRKLVKRVEDLINDSSALKAVFIPRLQHLVGLMALALNFGVNMAQQVRGYLLDVKDKKEAYKLTRVLEIVRSTAGEVKTGGGIGSWQTVSDLLTQLQRDSADVVSIASESESVMKITGVAPWLLRVEEIKALAAVNVDAERKIVKLNEEMQELVRGIKNRDQNIKETAVKVQLMERRMEASKKQAELLTDMEEQLAKARKQEKDYEEAMEQLQADLEVLEQDNSRLKQNLNNVDRQASGLATTSEHEVAPPIEGNLEVSHLLEQIESLRGAVRFLRTENGYLKGQEMLKEIQSLPALRSTIGSDGYSYGYSQGLQGHGHDAPRTPSLTADSGSSDIEDDGETSASASTNRRVIRAGKWTLAKKGKDNDKEAVSKGGTRDRDKQGKMGKGAKPSNHANNLSNASNPNDPHSTYHSSHSSSKPSLQALTTESKILYRELLEYSASPKLVDLAALEEERKRGWMPQRKTTAYQLWERKRVGDRLKEQVDGLRVQTARLVNSGGS